MTSVKIQLRDERDRKDPKQTKLRIRFVGISFDQALTFLIMATDLYGLKVSEFWYKAHTSEGHVVRFLLEPECSKETKKVEKFINSVVSTLSR